MAAIQWELAIDEMQCFVCSYCGAVIPGEAKDAYRFTHCDPRPVRNTPEAQQRLAALWEAEQTHEPLW